MFAIRQRRSIVDEELRKLEREFQANPTLGIAENIVQCRMRSGSLDTLIEVSERAFHPNQWHRLNEDPGSTSNSYLLLYLQLPHGILMKDHYGGGITFIPGIKIARNQKPKMESTAVRRGLQLPPIEE